MNPLPLETIAEFAGGIRPASGNGCGANGAAFALAASAVAPATNPKVSFRK